MILQHSFFSCAQEQMVQEDLAEMQRQQELRRRAIAQKNKTKEQLRSSTPEAVQGRKHNVVQTGLLFSSRLLGHVCL